MSYPQLFDIARGMVQHGSPVRRFGTNAEVGSTFVPITRGGIYMTPQISDAKKLRVRAGGNANDAAAGSGAREIMIEGIGVDGLPLFEAIATAGASASALTVASFLRVTRAYVSKSGTYATQTALSHAGSILIEDNTGQLWATIQDTTIPRGQTEIAVYTVPRYQQFYLTDITIELDASNKSNVVLFRRTGILQTVPPYDGMRLLHEFPSVSGQIQIRLDPPIVIEQLSDVGFLAATNTGTVSVSASLNGVELRV